jgi:2-oxoglutarate ferredoxin oxidoreductase subunit gamma
MIEKIIISGSGGQGIMLLGKVLAEAAMEEGKFVTWLPAYGAEVRGGTAHCMVTISDTEIGSPFIDKADTIIAMNAPSFKKFKNRLKMNGVFLINSSLVKELTGIRGIKGDFTDIAISLGNVKVANMVALGSYIKNKKVLSLKSILSVMKKMAPAGREDILKVNQEALDRGAKL